MRRQYVRSFEGKSEIMIEINPGEFVNTVSAHKLGLVAKENIGSAAIKKAA